MDCVKNIDFSSRLREQVESILSKKSRTTKKINVLAKIINFQDVLFYTWKSLLKTLIVKNENCDIFMLNVLELLEKISVNKVINKKEREKKEEKEEEEEEEEDEDEDEDEDEEDEILGFSTGSKKFVLDIKLLKHYVRKVWQILVNKEMSFMVHKKLLFVLLELYLSNLENPLFLTDFFMSSMNVRGVRILALQGVATLMQKHNIEYPNIYGKLYTMFEPSVFHTKYKSRLFYLANIFLSSTHLPENLVASFAKRASRLSLTCGTPDILIILKFVGNLLIRHSGLTKMIHHSSVVEVLEDPFLDDENDPMKTRALESSLWEISLLNDHCQPSISSAAKFIHCKLPSLEYDLGEVLDNSFEKLFESECKKTKKIKPSLTFHRPQETIAKLKDDEVFKLWCLTNQE